MFTTDKAERLIAEAAGHGAQLVVFPEAFVGGYPRGSTFGFGISISLMNPKDKGKEAFRRYHASAIDVPGTWKKNQKYFISYCFLIRSQVQLVYPFVPELRHY
jgi:hypothetical protein